MSGNLDPARPAQHKDVHLLVSLMLAIPTANHSSALASDTIVMHSLNPLLVKSFPSAHFEVISV